MAGIIESGGTKKVRPLSLGAVPLGGESWEPVEEAESDSAVDEVDDEYESAQEDAVPVGDVGDASKWRGWRRPIEDAGLAIPAACPGADSQSVPVP